MLPSIYGCPILARVWPSLGIFGCGIHCTEGYMGLKKNIKIDKI
jgi:hypothetical protein